MKKNQYKECYIVWNESIYGCEFFGAYRSWRRAFAQFRRVVRNRYGKCPQGGYEDIQDWLVDNEIEGDSLKITKIYENEGEDK